MNLYYGDNGVHEFWEDAERRFLIIRNHNETSWFALLVAGTYEPFGRAQRPKTVANRIQRHYGIVLQFDKSQQWTLPRKNAKRMVLAPSREAGIGR